jgi:hypothetical protein
MGFMRVFREIMAEIMIHRPGIGKRARGLAVTQFEILRAAKKKTSTD